MRCCSLVNFSLHFTRIHHKYIDVGKSLGIFIRFEVLLSSLPNLAISRRLLRTTDWFGTCLTWSAFKPEQDVYTNSESSETFPNILESVYQWGIPSAVLRSQSNLQYVLQNLMCTVVPVLWEARTFHMKYPILEGWKYLNNVSSFMLTFTFCFVQVLGPEFISLSCQHDTVGTSKNSG